MAAEPAERKSKWEHDLKLKADLVKYVKERMYGGPQLSRQIKIDHGKLKSITAN